jgi:hypothetical protein
VIGVFLSIALLAELTILATVTSAQDYATGPASAPSPISAGSAINSGASGTSNPAIGSVNPSQVPPNPSLLAVPIVGTAPLTVDFYIGLPNTPVQSFTNGTSAMARNHSCLPNRTCSTFTRIQGPMCASSNWSLREGSQQALLRR